MKDVESTGIEERADNLPPAKSERPLRRVPFQNLKAYLKNDVSPNALLEFELMVLAFAAGINDATTYPDYHVFASNQTGNTALLGVGALDIAKDSIDIRDVAFSLSLFILGGFVLGQAGHYFGRTRRAWLLATNLLQSTMVLAAAALRKWYAVETTTTAKHDPRRYSVITLLAFASGGQVAMARSVNVPEVTTAMVTSAYIDFLADPNHFVRRNRSRDRRFMFVLALLGGSLWALWHTRRSSLRLRFCLPGWQS